MSSDKQIVELKKNVLEKLLRRLLGPDLIVENFTTKPLTKLGDNYGSTILDVEVFYHEGENNKLHKLPIVAKLVPESPFLRHLFNIGITFNKEVRAYTLVSPEFHKLQKEKGIPESEMLDIFAKYYGSRSNKQDDINMEADDSAVLFIENLKLSGYEIRDRRKGLNLKHMEFTLDKLAQFHALGIVLKLLKPQVFRDTILKTCEKFNLGIPVDDETIQKSVNTVIGFIEGIPECVQYMEVIEKNMRLDNEIRKEYLVEQPPREPFATIVHYDFWVNNMMFKYDQCGNETDKLKNGQIPTAMKFVDFQVTIYDSPVRDLMFFLFTSSENGLLDKYFDYLVKFYHSKFIKVLESFDCDTRPFSYEHFQEEINIICPKEFTHILYLLNPISADSEGMEEISSFNEDSLHISRGGDVYRNKLRCLIQTYAVNGWL